MTLKYRIYVGGFSLIVILQNSFDVGFSIGLVSARGLWHVVEC